MLKVPAEGWNLTVVIGFDVLIKNEAPPYRKYGDGPLVVAMFQLSTHKLLEASLAKAAVITPDHVVASAALIIVAEPPEKIDAVPPPTDPPKLLTYPSALAKLRRRSLTPLSYMLSTRIVNFLIPEGRAATVTDEPENAVRALDPIAGEAVQETLVPSVTRSFPLLLA